MSSVRPLWVNVFLFPLLSYRHQYTHQVRKLFRGGASSVELQSRMERALRRPSRTLKMIMIMMNMLYIHYIVQLGDET